MARVNHPANLAARLQNIRGSIERTPTIKRNWRNITNQAEIELNRTADELNKDVLYRNQDTGEVVWQVNIEYLNFLQWVNEASTNSGSR